MHQSTTPSLWQTIWPRWPSSQFLSVPIVQTLLPVIFGYSLSSEAVVMRPLRRWKRTCMGPSRSCWNGTTIALQPEETTSRETWVSCVYYQYKCSYEKSLETYLMILVYIYIYIYVCVCVCVCVCVKSLMHSLFKGQSSPKRQLPQVIIVVSVDVFSIMVHKKACPYTFKKIRSCTF